MLLSKEAFLIQEGFFSALIWVQIEEETRGKNLNGYLPCSHKPFVNHISLFVCMIKIYLILFLFFGSSQLLAQFIETDYQTARELDSNIIGLSFTPKQELLVTSATGVKVLDTRLQQLYSGFNSSGKNLAPVATAAINSAAVSLAGGTAYAIANTEGIAIVSLLAGNQLMQLRAPGGKPLLLTADASGELLAAITAEGFLHLWQLQSGRWRLLQSWQSYSRKVKGIALGARGKLLVVVHTDGAFTSWWRGPKGFTASQTYNSSVSRPEAISLSDHQALLAIAGVNGVQVWQLSPQASPANVYNSSSAIENLALSPCNHVFASSTSFDGLQLQPIGRAANRKKISAEVGGLIAFSADGIWLAATESRNTAKLHLWRVSGCQPGEAKLAVSAKGAPPMLVVNSVTFTEAQLDAGETAKLTIEVENRSKENAALVSLKLKHSTAHLRFTPPQTQWLLPGQKLQLLTTVTATDALSDGEAWIDAAVADERFNIQIPVNRVSFATRKKSTPVLSINALQLEEYAAATPDFKLQPNEMAQLHIQLLNKGQGLASDINVQVLTDQAGVLVLGQVQNEQVVQLPQAIKQLGPGHATPLIYRLFITGEFTDASLKLQVMAKSAEGASVVAMHELPVNKLKASGEVKILRSADPALTTAAPKVLLTEGISIRSNLPKAAQQNLTAVAVVIGNKDYRKADLPNNKYAHEDALLMRQYLIESLGYREANIILMLNATQADFNTVFGTEAHPQGKLHQLLQGDAKDLFVYYSGHGAPDPSSGMDYFLPIDADPNLLALNAYPLQLFYSNLSKLNFKTATVVTDASFSGQHIGGTAGEELTGIGIQQKQNLLRHPKANVYQSASGNEQSNWYPNMRHSLFTYYFLRGLQGEADQNSDRIIQHAELQEYLELNVPYAARKLHQRNQQPQITGNGERELGVYRKR